MERGFLSQKGSGGGRGAKEKNVVVPPMVEEPGLGGPMLESVTISGNSSDWWGTKDSGDATNTQIDEYISGPTANVVANVTVSPTSLIPSGPTSYTKLVNGITIKKSVNFRTLITPTGNGAEVVVPLESIRAISERFVNTAYGFFLGKRVAYPVVSNYVRNTWWNLDVNLMKEDVGNVPVWFKLHGVPVTAFSEDGLSVISTKLGTPLMRDSYTSDMCIKSWGRSSYARALIKIQADVELKDTIVVDECPKNIGSDVAKNLKKPSQAPRGVPVGPKVGFKPTKQVYRLVSKKTNANTSENKNKDLDPTKEIERLIIDGKFTLVDDEGKPLENVVSSGDHDSDDEVESIDNEMTSFLASKKVGYGQKIPDKIQSVCDNLDIKVRGCKKKKFT
ncbi:putative ribonuclease H-like domain-containing protein [Tanacetum coccineum]